MSYPHAGFSSFVFKREEHVLFGTDSNWKRALSLARSRPLGAAVDNIVYTAAGSLERSFEVLLTPDRYDVLILLLGTTGTFVDWTRPLPAQRSAFLSEVSPEEDLAVICSDGTTERRIRTRLELISQ